MGDKSALAKSHPVAKQLTLFDLETLEKKVRAGLAQFMEVGESLAKIRDLEGYRLRGYKDFSSYCEKELHFSLRQGQRLIAAAETAETVKKLTGGDAPRNEAAARVLAPIAQDEKVVQRVASTLKKSGKSIGEVTAEKLQEVVARVTGKAPASNGKNGKVEVLAPALKDIASLNDKCPNCGRVPGDYIFHVEHGWQCGLCFKPVRLLVASAVVDFKACPTCGRRVDPAAVMCEACGEVL